MGYSGGKLPNANATLVLGILSIVGCLFYGIPGLVCGVIALVIHKKDKAIYKADPGRYEMSFKNAKGGFVCAIIGTSLSGIYALTVLVAFVFAFSSIARF
ncbi:MAG: DUF4190 domain-containing protein [Crocinitomicaceae bacterium]|nr:DUF4190 domain-containing protein [Crocinitomicaceae bacterium]